MRERRAAGGDVPPTVALGSLRFGARDGPRVCPSALPATEHSGMPEENLAAESRPPRDRSAARSSRPGRGAAPAAPACRGRKRRMRGSEFPSSPGHRSEESAPPPRSPRQDRCPGGGGRAARPEESSTCHFGRL